MGNLRTTPLSTVDIDGNNYTMIAERVLHLANNFVYSIQTSEEFIEKLNAWKVKATLTITEFSNQETFVNIYNGTAVEVIGSNDINSTSALENAETSAVGRACAFAGIGVTESIASGNEVKGAKEKLKEFKTESRRKAGKTAEDKTLQKLLNNEKV